MIELMVLLLTVSGAVAVALLLLDFAVIVVLPSATAVTKPELSMVATLVSEDNHVTLSVTSPLVLLPKMADAVNCWVVVTLIQPLVGERESEVIESEAGKNPLQLARSRAEARATTNLLHHLIRCISNILIVRKAAQLHTTEPGLDSLFSFTYAT